MTTSGLGSWIPTIGEIIDDALEYAGIDPASANARHLKSAMRSLNQVYLWLENNNEALFRDDIESISIRRGQAFFYAPAGTLTIKKGVIRAVGQPTSYENNIDVFPKAVWFDMPAKGQVGRPSILALNYSTPITPDHLLSDAEKLISDPEDTNSNDAPYSDGGYGDYDWASAPAEGDAYTPGMGPQVILWPIPDMDYRLDYTRVRQTQQANRLGENMDVRSIWINAITFRLGYFLALKYNPKLAGNLKGESEQALDQTKMNNRESADIWMSAASMSPVRSRRRFR